MANDSIQEYYSGLIAQVASKDKFLEFTDAMVPAYEKDYGMIQGAVGKDHAANSGIRVSIISYGEGKTKGRVSALVPTWVFEQIKDNCLKNCGEIILPQGDAVKLVNGGIRAFHAFRTLLSEAKSGLVDVVTGKENDVLIALGKALRSAQFKVYGLTETNTPDKTILQYSTLAVPFAVDYKYHQVRVNSSIASSNGTVPCNILTISRRSIGKDLDGNDKVYNQPWCVNISSFFAVPVNHSTGTVSYDAATVDNRNDGNFYLSNEDMFRCAYAIEHFVSQWERANIDNFMKGMEETAKRRKEYLQKR